MNNNEEVKSFVSKLNSIGVDTKNLDLVDLMNLGQILSAIGSLNPLFSILLSDCFSVLEKQKFVSEEQCSNALSPITSTESGQMTSIIFLFSIKQL